jgi:phospholipid/cholesterol/gamma-HCH transport system substrate-binding protein
MAEHFKLRRVNEITGTFVLVIVAVLVAAVVWMGHSQRWFRSRVTLQIVLPEAGAAGIRQGSEVYFLGTLVGSVSDVIVDTTGRMAAETNIRRDFFRFVRADSSAVVKKKFGVAGDAFFEITRGEGQPLPEEGASIVCNEQFQSPLETAVDEIRREALLVLKKTSAGLDTWTQFGADMESMAAAVKAGKGTVGKLITDTALVDEAQNILARASETMAHLQSVVTRQRICPGSSTKRRLPCANWSD